MKRFLLFLFTIGLFATSVCGQTKPSTNQPNILFILSDDHSESFWSGSGNHDLKTPNLNRLAAEGVRFTRAYTTAPQCVPSRASLMTGRCPVDVEMTRFSAPLAAEYVTLPELLREHGYHTGIGGRHFHLDGSTYNLPANDSLYANGQLKTFRRRVDFLKDASALNGEQDSASVAIFAEFLQRRDAQKPFFFWLNFSNPHRPLNRFANRPDPASLTLPPDFPDTKLLREDLADLYGEVQDLDRTMGRVLTLLQQMDLTEETIIVFMGDNGSSVLRGKGTLHERGLNVPLMVRFPGKARAGTVHSELVSGEDIAPTLLNWAGRAAPAEMTGRSFAAIRDKPLSATQPYVFAERGPHGNGFPTQTASFDLSRVVIGKRYKLIFNVLWQLPYSPVDFNNSPAWLDLKQQNEQGKLAESLRTMYFQPRRPVFELYDLETDPYEQINRIDDPAYKSIAYDLKIALNEWMLRNRDYLPLPLTGRDQR